MTIFCNIQYEMTDTFGGESNYSWVRRDMIELRPVGQCVVIFITFHSFGSTS